MNGTDKRIDELEQKLAEVDALDIKASAEIKDHFEKLLAESPLEPKSEDEFENHSALQFEQWEWGYAEDHLPGLNDFWEAANKNGARVAVEMMLQSEAFTRRWKTKDGKTRWEIAIGPLVLKFDEAQIDEEDNEAEGYDEGETVDYRVAILPVELGEEWME